MQGTITFWNKNKAYGFIKTIVSGKHESYFCHISGIVEGELVPSVGDKVQFDAVPAEPGRTCGSAANVKITSAPSGGAR